MRILHITYGFDGGGVGFVIASYCATRPLQGVQFDIVGEDTGHEHLLHQRFANAGFRVYYVTPKKRLFRNIRQMFRLLRKGDYDGVHVHFEEWSFLYLWLARLARIPVRICHAHMAYMVRENEKPHYKVFRRLLNRYATCRLACSTDAGEHLFGGYEYTVLRNAIPVEEFLFDQNLRNQVRREMLLEQHFVVGNVARLSYQKNPLFTLEIFKEILQKRPDAVLLLIGSGELEAELRRKIDAEGLQESVRLLGLRTDVPRLMQAMDVFLLPSRFEGLGVAYVEAQAAGLKTFATQDLVPQEAMISDMLMTYLPLQYSASQWADAVLAQCPYQRLNMMEQVHAKGYDLSDAIGVLESIYLKQGRKYVS